MQHKTEQNLKKNQNHQNLNLNLIKKEQNKELTHHKARKNHHQILQRMEPIHLKKEQTKKLIHHQVGKAHHQILQKV